MPLSNAGVWQDARVVSSYAARARRHIIAVWVSGDCGASRQRIIGDECRVQNAAGVSPIRFKDSAALDVEAIAPDANVRLNKAQWSEAGKHLPENLGDKPFE
jgi:hypothetical protein